MRFGHNELAPTDKEVAYLVGVVSEREDIFQVREELDELAELTRTAGAEVSECLVVHRKGGIDPDFYVGKGKCQEIIQAMEHLGCNLLVTNDELTPRQHKNLENTLEVKVLDRTDVILDIFAKHAVTTEGRLQVEAAQLHHLLPRLRNRRDLSRLGGGIGTRGPGEQKLEMDRRVIRKRIQMLERRIDEIGRRRAVLRERRKSQSIPNVALVGYTNAGKSSLLNALTEAGVLVEDKLFATLDPTTRAYKLPSGKVISITDTVGFIRKVPADIVAAFRATIEDIVESDVICQVCDITSPSLEQKVDAVDEILADIGIGPKPQILIFNKVDLVGPQIIMSKLQHLKNDVRPKILVSALKHIGLDKLAAAIQEMISINLAPFELTIPYIYEKEYFVVRHLLVIEKEVFEDAGIFVKGLGPEGVIARLSTIAHQLSYPRG